ncbi:MAG: HD domain-containing protein [Chloroflexota bacterium]
MMEFEENAGLLIEAMFFSANKHRNQRRKDTEKSPYINHPIDVTHLLWTVGSVREVPVLLACILHDTIEDTQTTHEEVAEMFGQEVLSLVLEVTDDKSLPKQERKRLQIVTAPLKSPGAKLIKLADKCCNVRDVVVSPPADWSLERRREYLLWTERVVAGLRGINPGLEKYYDEHFAHGKEILGLT